MKLAINKRMIDKNILDDRKANVEGWENLDPTPKELAALINAGYAISPQVQDGHRKGSNFICSGYIAADVDEGMSIEEGLANDFVTSHASIFHTTASHKPEAHRFRIIFELETPITDPEVMRWAMIGISKKFRSDPSTIDPARMFYGSRNSKPTVFGNKLPDAVLKEIIELGKTPRILSDKSSDDKKGAGVAIRSPLRLDPNADIIDRDGISRKLKELPNRTPVFCPFHEDRHPSAFLVKSRKGSLGIHCSACHATYWAGSAASSYNFYRLDETIKEIIHQEQAHPEIQEDTGKVVWREYFDLEKDPWHIVCKDIHLPDIHVVEGITFVKSPKGTGKTELLKRQVSELKDMKKRILLVGHRQALLHQSADRLGLNCYLSGQKADISATPHYAISVDSLANRDLINPSRDKYDAIIIDESEQVFSHFMSDTLKDTRRLAFFTLQHYLHEASTIVVLDADQNAVTLEALTGMAEPKMDVRLVLNEYRNEDKPIDLYDSKNHLEADLFEAIRRGERCFVPSNSKNFVDATEEAIRKEFGERVKLVKFTRDNSSQPEIIDLIKHLKKRILDYQVVLASPTLGTGIDISFEDKVQHVDGVFGFFEARINTHFDIDQQLYRVRDPKYVKVWISPERFNFEIEESVILNELIENEAFPELMNGYGPDGRVKIDEKDPFLNLYASILAAQRASKNNLRGNFIELRKRNGWTINEVGKDTMKAGEGGRIIKEGKEIKEQKRVGALLAARRLTTNEFLDRREKRRKKIEMSVLDSLELERAYIERFYGQDLTKQLIKQDNHGKLRDQVKAFEVLFNLHLDLGKSLSMIRTDLLVDQHNKQKSLLKTLLTSAGVMDSEGKPVFDQPISLGSLEGFIKVCKKQKATINRMFDIQVRADLSSKPMTQLNILLGMVGLKAVKVGKKKKGAEETNLYHLDRNAWSNMVDIAEQRHKRRLQELGEEQSEDAQ